MSRVITFGTYDLFHVGHLRMLERAKALGGYLAVGVSSDDLNIRKKGRAPVYPQSDRMAIVRALACVDEVFSEESMDQKGSYCDGFDIFVIGDDWAGQFDDLKDISVRYLPRTPEISTTELLERIKTGSTN